MAKFCVNCGKSLGFFSDEFVLNSDAYLCSRCAENIRNDIIDTYYIKSEAEFKLAKEKILKNASENCTSEVLSLIEQKLDFIFYKSTNSESIIAENTANSLNAQNNTNVSSDLGMFSNIGGKIKTLATVVTWFGLIASFLVGICMLFVETISGFIIMIVGGLLSWIGSFTLYGFGQLIENTDIIVKKLNK